MRTWLARLIALLSWNRAMYRAKYKYRSCRERSHTSYLALCMQGFS